MQTNIFPPFLKLEYLEIGPTYTAQIFRRNF